MFHNIMAIELLVRDLARCTAFYRDTLGLEVQESESTSDSISFQMGNVHFFLLGVSGAAQMISEKPLELQSGMGRNTPCVEYRCNPQRPTGTHLEYKIRARREAPGGYV
ncbi:MAG TPA: VOC family protein [Ktedonobacteraceae bacterium]|nr:VOC family protein [Ktedonobacteraceae bacterium]